MKTIIVCMHLIAVSVALGITFIQDLAFARAKGGVLSQQSISELKRAADLVVNALVALTNAVSSVSWLFACRFVLVPPL